jgi:Zn-dependent protease/predicted transcriptional regulator
MGDVVGNAVTVARVAGIPIAVHWSWLFMFGLVAWTLAQGLFPSWVRGLAPTTYWLMAIASSLGLFASVLVHELSHSLVALARGLGVHDITLFIFGGVSNLTEEATEPRDEFLVAVVGPLTSFAVAGLCWSAIQVMPGRSPVGVVLAYLVFVNLLLGAFNLLPGFPLDGGRVLRSILWGATGSLGRATTIASFIGQGMGFLLMGLGAWRGFQGDLFGGMWTIFIGWFLQHAARSAQRQTQLRERLRGVRVAQVMRRQPVAAAPELSLQDFVYGRAVGEGDWTLPVVEGDRVVGVVSVRDAKRVRAERWSTTPVRAVMVTGGATVSPWDELSKLLDLMVDDELDQVSVVESDRLVGMVSRADVLRFLEAREERPLPHGPAPEGSAEEPRRAA